MPMHGVQNDSKCVFRTIEQTRFMVPMQNWPKQSAHVMSFKIFEIFLWDQVTETGGPGERHLHVRQLGEGSAMDLAGKAH